MRGYVGQYCTNVGPSQPCATHGIVACVDFNGRSRGGRSAVAAPRPPSHYTNRSVSCNVGYNSKSHQC